MSSLKRPHESFADRRLSAGGQYSPTRDGPTAADSISDPSQDGGVGLAGEGGRALCTVRISTVILFAMLVSCGASIIGGLIMYEEAVDSLTETVRVSSRSELTAVVEDVMHTVRDTIHATEALRNVMLAQGFIATRNQTEWAEQLRHVMYGIVKATPSVFAVGTVLLPQVGQPMTRAVYNLLFIDASRNVSYATYHAPHLNPPLVAVDPLNASSPYTITPMMHRASFVDGSIMKQIGVFPVPAAHYTHLLPEGFDPRNGSQELLVEHGWERPVDGDGKEAQVLTSDIPDLRRFEGLLGIKRRPVRDWITEDNSIHTYGGYDLLYAAPPPPHPWSVYRAINIPALSFHEHWGKVVRRYASLNPDTIIAVVDTDTEYVYALSTTDTVIIDAECGEARLEGKRGGSMARLTVLQDCAVTVDLAPAKVRDAYRKLQGGGDFIETEVDGEAFFLRKEHMLNHLMMVWMRPRSAVQQKVKDAMVLFILFVLLVLLVDAALAAIELFLVARPIRRVAAALRNIGRMQLRKAAQHIQSTRSAVMLAEVHAVVDGAEHTLANLVEYSSYLPEALVEAPAGPSVAPPCGQVAFALLDIVGAADLWEAVPGEIMAALDLYNDAVRSLICTHRGYEVKHAGGAFLAAFSSTLDAVCFAADVQRDLLCLPWPDGLPIFQHSRREIFDGVLVFNGLRVRIALHSAVTSLQVDPDSFEVECDPQVTQRTAEILHRAVDGMTIASLDLMRDVDDKMRAKADISVCPLPAAEWLLGTQGVRADGDSEMFWMLPRALSKRKQGFFDQLRAREHARRTGAGQKGVPTISAKGVNASHAKLSGEPAISEPALSEVNHLNRKLTRSFGAVVVLSLERIRALGLCSASEEESSVLLSFMSSSIQMANYTGCITSGRIENVHGHLIVMSWGLAHRVSEPALQSLRFMGIVLQKKAMVTMGGVVGPLLHGNVGTVQRRYHNVFGLGHHYASRLLGMCEAHETDALFIAKGGVPASAGGACIPVDVVKTEGEFSPFMVVENPCVWQCSRLCPEWIASEERMSVADAASEKERRVATMALRSAVIRAAETGGPFAVDLPSGCPAEIIDSAKKFAARGEFVTGAATMAAAPTREISKAVISKELGRLPQQLPSFHGSEQKFEFDLTIATPRTPKLPEEGSSFANVSPPSKTPDSPPIPNHSLLSASNVNN
eukprot:TRINITY_DN5022_c0_g1_i1.p1 TRINITY_DN5022_c0_g1~~TRINITY_DN5022_c0_g1_i1.p1  ORF type:complete len:1183 (+),score=290.71 TRINITY_DN5022_c0_g1_i1:104-3652(+)